MTLWKDVTCQSFKPRWRADMFIMLVWFVELLMHLHDFFFIVGNNAFSCTCGPLWLVRIFFQKLYSFKSNWT